MNSSLPRAAVRCARAQRGAITYTYDALNRLQTKAYSDGVTAPVTMTYDGAGAGTCPGSGTAATSRCPGNQ